jgi:alkylation response protein AidB-like acyl-CoA dehydrogenase
MLTRQSPVHVPEEELHWVDEVAAFGADFAQTVMDDDRKGEVPIGHLRTLSDSGLDAAFLPVAHGGSGLSYATLAAVVRTLAVAHPSVAALWLMHLGAAHALVTQSAPDAAAYFAAELQAGRRFANALSEPAGGNFFLTSQQDAPAVEGGWTFTGRKMFVTGSEVADHVLLNARVEGESAFFGVTLDDTVSFPPIDATIGMRATRSRGMAFDGSLLRSDRRCGPPPVGYANLITVGFAQLSVGIAESAIDALSAYAKARSLTDTEWIRMEVGMMWAETRAAALLADQTAFLADLHDPQAMANATEAKMLANEVAKRAAALAVRVGGGSGYLEKSPIQRIARDAQAGALMAYSVPFSQSMVGGWVLNAG